MNKLCFSYIFIYIVYYKDKRSLLSGSCGKTFPTERVFSFHFFQRALHSNITRPSFWFWDMRIKNGQYFSFENFIIILLNILSMLFSTSVFWFDCLISSFGSQSKIFIYKLDHACVLVAFKGFHLNHLDLIIDFNSTNLGNYLATANIWWQGKPIVFQYKHLHWRGSALVPFLNSNSILKHVQQKMSQSSNFYLSFNKQDY